MKRTILDLALVLAFSVVPSLASASPARSAQDDAKAFRTEFQAAMKLNSREEMARLVQQNVGPAVEWIIETVEEVADRPSDATFDRLDAFKQSWRDSMDTDFVEDMERYFSLMDPVTKRERSSIRLRYNRSNGEYQGNLEVKDGQVFGRLSLEFETLADAFEQVGDRYFASQCWFIVASCWDEEYRGNKADLAKAAEAYQKALRHREAIQLEDRLYTLNKARFETLVRLGFGPEGSVPTAQPGAPAPVASAGGPISVPMTFALVEEIDDVERPSYFADPVYQMWTGVSLEGKGSSTTFPRIPDGPTVMRLGAADVQLDTNGDGKGDQPIPLTGNLEPVRFNAGSGDTTRACAVLTTTGIEKDVYQGFDMNLAATDDYMTLFYVGAGSMQGVIGETPVRVIDEDVDGVYGNVPRLWGHVGASDGAFQPEVDSVVLGDADRAVPWSEFTQVDGKWYKLELVANGTELRATPTELATGHLRLKYKGPKPTWLVVQGGGTYERCFYDLADAGSKGVEVPIGRYKLFFGEVRKGKKQQTVKTLILPGASTPGWTVDAGGTVDVELGAPYGFDFRYDTGDESVTVEGQSVVVVGSANERYERPWNCVAHPEVSVRKKGSKRGSKPEEMGSVMTQNELVELGWPSAWFPRDTVVEKKAGEEVEVQLTEKKHALFGKIESVWK